MARQFREQLEEEVQGEEARKRAAAGASANSSPAAGERPTVSAEPANPGNPAGPVAPGDAVVRPLTFSHAQPLDAMGAEPPVPRAGHAPSADEPST